MDGVTPGVAVSSEICPLALIDVTDAETFLEIVFLETHLSRWPVDNFP